MLKMTKEEAEQHAREIGLELFQTLRAKCDEAGLGVLLYNFIRKMSIVFTDSDVESIIRFHINKALPMAPVLLARMSPEHSRMWVEHLHEMVKRHIELEREVERKTKR